MTINPLSPLDVLLVGSQTFFFLPLGGFGKEPKKKAEYKRGAWRLDTGRAPAAAANDTLSEITRWRRGERGRGEEGWRRRRRTEREREREAEGETAAALSSIWPPTPAV